MSSQKLLQNFGGYKNLKSFQIAQLCYDVTVRFCDAYISRYSRTHDQMVQAARSGVQNIAEGSKASGTSKKMEIKLTNVARASLEELRLDYQDFLRQKKLPAWPRNDPRRRSLVSHRCTTADEVALWVRDYGLDHKSDCPSSPSSPCRPSSPSKSSTYAGPAANAALVLIEVACALLDRQVAAQAAAFEKEGGFTERLYRFRTKRGR
ncbi:MAG: four helix bundle suffix domain-containing protein [Puniceicoccaceae bacterium]